MSSIDPLLFHFRLKGSNKVWAYSIFPCILFCLFIVLYVLQISVDGTWAMAWFFYLCFTTLLSMARSSVRAEFDVSGSFAEDFLAATFAYPLCAVQLDEATKNMESRDQNKKDPESIDMKNTNNKGQENVAYVSNETS